MYDDTSVSYPHTYIAVQIRIQGVKIIKKVFNESYIPVIVIANLEKLKNNDEGFKFFKSYFLSY